MTDKERRGKDDRRKAQNFQYVVTILSPLEPREFIDVIGLVDSYGFADCHVSIKGKDPRSHINPIKNEAP